MFKDDIITYCKSNDFLQIEDIFKYLYQSCFGCEHLAEDFDTALSKINGELEFADGDKLEKIEKLDCGFCRVHLKILNDGLSAKTLCKLFVLSAGKQSDGKEKLEKKLEELIGLSEEKLIPFEASELKTAVEKWKEKGYPPCHHSDSFRSNYHPAYRVISKKYAELIPLLIAVDKKLNTNGITVAIEGRCASGKTTVSELLKEIYDCNVFHMDDFFLPPEMKTEERLSLAGENIDHERFLEEVLVPLSRKKTVSYSRYNCRTGKKEEPIPIKYNRLNVVEGVYSFHEKLIGYYDLKVFLDITSEEQRERIIKRNPPLTAEKFFGIWIPLEEKYFNEFSVKEKADLILKTK